MYKTIVVGTDGSDQAGVAVRHATMLARLTGASPRVVGTHQTLSPSAAARTVTAGGPTVDFAIADTTS